MEIGFVGDLCRHLRKSLQASSESVGEQELNLNIMLQNSIEDCLLEIAKAVGLKRIHYFSPSSFVYKFEFYCKLDQCFLLLKYFFFME